MNERSQPEYERQFLDDTNEWRRLFAELFGTFLLVFVACGADMVNTRFGGHAISSAARVTAPGLMVAAIILFMGSVSGAHLNPVVTLAFAWRRDFPWKRVPAYLVAQAVGGTLAALTLVALLHEQRVAGTTVPAPGVSATTAMLWELLLTVGLVSTILGTCSGAHNVGTLNAFGVGGYIALAGLFGEPVSGASMNPVRSLAPALVLAHWTAWWAYVVGPFLGAVIAVGFAWILRGPGGGFYGKLAAQGALGTRWHPGPIAENEPD
jgi:aquaporin Z